MAVSNLRGGQGAILRAAHWNLGDARIANCEDAIWSGWRGWRPYWTIARRRWPCSNVSAACPHEVETVQYITQVHAEDGQQAKSALRDVAAYVFDIIRLHVPHGWPLAFLLRECVAVPSARANEVLQSTSAAYGCEKHVPCGVTAMDFIGRSVLGIVVQALASTRTWAAEQGLLRRAEHGSPTGDGLVLAGGCIHNALQPSSQRLTVVQADADVFVVVMYSTVSASSGHAADTTLHSTASDIVQLSITDANRASRSRSAFATACSISKGSLTTCNASVSNIPVCRRQQLLLGSMGCHDEDVLHGPHTNAEFNVLLSEGRKYMDEFQAQHGAKPASTFLYNVTAEIHDRDMPDRMMAMHAAVMQLWIAAAGSLRADTAIELFYDYGMEAGTVLKADQDFARSVLTAAQQARASGALLATTTPAKRAATSPAEPHTSAPARTWMKDDARRYQPFRDHFTLTRLMSTANPALAQKMEALYIAQFKARGPGGYNVLHGPPSASPAFSAMSRQHASSAHTPTAVTVQDDDASATLA
ncbi:hypothetical protein VOLCADRAFT_88475 [Volvox carteri f. nagariensis]|uniref:Uncharacterized protein n=1 Tax=Volvox carteri f. nagariensis TaxID=3068 RepID=D8TP36_VOLCA|nr:uncharacterized protein VOLCADRAFT_88475 [Volvox carteri f. nagariensis]EFJ50691.1 hypothetical protein VOLCADRAFT_88475 [Volvox carteri f. nagariensis]|eukprot:XP_002948284.1 hypothetical protein VOLCADRAFT_88475 [Volvox carteri f. nagariensis]